MTIPPLHSTVIISQVGNNINSYYFTVIISQVKLLFRKLLFRKLLFRKLLFRKLLFRKLLFRNYFASREFRVTATRHAAAGQTFYHIYLFIYLFNLPKNRKGAYQ